MKELISVGAPADTYVSAIGNPGIVIWIVRIGIVIETPFLMGITGVAIAIIISIAAAKDQWANVYAKIIEVPMAVVTMMVTSTAVIVAATAIIIVLPPLVVRTFPFHFVAKSIITRAGVLMYVRKARG